MVHLLVSKRVLFLIDPCSIVVNVKMIILLQVRLVNIENPNSIEVLRLLWVEHEPGKII